MDPEPADPARAMGREVLAAAATAFGDVPGVEVMDDGDLVRAFAPGLPQPWVNTIAGLRIEAGSFAARVAAVEAPYRAAGLPTSWWLDDWTAPADAAERLRAVGLRPGGAEAVMVVDLPAPHVADADSDVPGAARGADRPTLRVVRTLDDLDAWIAVMGASYGWVDAVKAAAMRRLYDPTSPHGRSGRRIGVLADLRGDAVGAASLFQAAGQGWVTNVGTIPAARGRGVRAAVTRLTLALAAERGDRTAWLAASAMGEPVYRRLGFRTVGRLTHLLGPAPLR